MNIRKLIKGYFIFVMALSFFALLSYNDNVNNMILSVLHAGNSLTTNSNYNLFAGSISGIDDVVFSSENNNSALLNFNIENDPENAFVSPGTEDAELMDFVLKSGDEDVLLEKLKLKVSGIDESLIGKVKLMDGEDVLARGKRDGEYFVFDGLNYEISENSGAVLKVYVSLSSDIHTGERFRMDIETPSDISLFVGGEPYSIDAFYPIKGKYLSVVNKSK